MTRAAESSEPDATELEPAPAGVAPVVAIVGRPNVGKSTLFNRMVGARQAIVEDNPGVTRDRLYGVAVWEGRSFVVVDTGGVAPGEGLVAHVRSQTDLAIAEADLVLLVIEATTGPTPTDAELATTLRRAGKPVIVVANKADSPAREQAAVTAWELGLGETFAVSAQHGRGVGELLDAVLAAVPAIDEALELVPEGTRITLLGRPNAGKSTLVNTLLGDARVIVDATPGTTRDAVYVPLEYRGEKLVLVDTAGLRRRRQVARAQEQLAAIKSIRALERTEVAVLVVDAAEGITDQDQRIAQMAHERGKGVVVVLHKWDLVRGDTKLARERMTQVEETLGFLHRPDVLRTSVLGVGRDAGTGRGRNLDETLNACLRTAAALRRRISTSDLNEELQRAVAEHNPPMFQGRPVRLYFATQADSSPPLVVISANRGRCLPAAWERYFLHRIRDRWDLRGIPVRLVVRARKRKGD